MEDVTRDLYWVTVQYSRPMGGTIQLFAESLEHAKEMVRMAHQGAENFKILDAYCLSDKQKQDILTQQMAQMEFDFDVDKEKMN